MPIIEQAFAHTVDTATYWGSADTDYPDNFKINNDIIAQYTNQINRYSSNYCWTSVYVHEEGTQVFYNDLCTILQTITMLDITYNTNEYSFDIWGHRFYIRSLSLLNGFSNQSKPTEASLVKGVSVPCIYNNNIPLTQDGCATRSFLGWHGSTATNSSNNTVPLTFTNGAYGNITLSSSLQQFSYSICVRYNTNYINISYITSEGHEMPLMFFIKGHTVDNKNIYFLTQGGGTFDWQYNLQSIPLSDLRSSFTTTNKYSGNATSSFDYQGFMYAPYYHIFIENKLLTTSTNNSLLCIISNMMQNIFQKTKLQAYTNLFNAANFVTSKFIWLDGYADFDNILMAPPNLPDYNKNYTIDGELYWASGSYIESTTRNWEALGKSEGSTKKQYRANFYYFLKL